MLKSGRLSYQALGQGKMDFRKRNTHYKEV
jgi:hypothetical protein